MRPSTSLTVQHTGHADVVLDGRGVGVQYRGSRGSVLDAVRGIDVCVRRREIVALVGESGSGKTSAAMVFAGLRPASAGRITLLGQELTSLSRRRRRELRPQVQVIFQDPQGSLDPRQSVVSGLEELRRIHPARTDWIDNAELLARVGIGAEMLSRYPHQLSGGQAQRVCIARALLLRPALLIADEPTSGLDVSVQAQIVNLLVALRESEDVAILLVSHDLSLVRRMCDVVHVMHQGTIVESGVPDAVMRAPVDDYTCRLVAAVPGARFRSEHRSPGGRADPRDAGVPSERSDQCE